MEAVENRKFDKFLAQEEVWIRKGVEARRTRNEGRVKRLDDLRLERAERRDRLATSSSTMAPGDVPARSWPSSIDVSKRYGEQGRSSTNSRDASCAATSIGLIGPNGAGKTTLIKLILGEIPPDCGHVRARHERCRSRTSTRCARSSIRNVRLADTISPGSDWVEINGAAQARDELSGATSCSQRERARAPVKSLSGGERNRLLLARLFARPANVLGARRADERPRHRTLELLEELLQDYDGTVLLVSHDRAFLDNVVTQTLAAEGDGSWRQYVGGYADWLRQRPAPAATAEERPLTQAPAPRAKPRTKLSYKEERELSSLPRGNPGARARATRSHGSIEQRGASSQRRGARPSGHPARPRHRAAAGDKVRALGGARAAPLRDWRRSAFLESTAQSLSAMPRFQRDRQWR